MSEESSTQKNPWEYPEEWSQVELSIRQARSAMTSPPAELNTLTQQIATGYAEIENELNRLCHLSCICCITPCCTKATVWYDLKDLLFIFFYSGAFPTRQIFRTSEGCCCNLTSSGCRIIRPDRPFICSWYICATQKQILTGESVNELNIDLLSSITEMKWARKELETIFINTACF